MLLAFSKETLLPPCRLFRLSPSFPPSLPPNHPQQVPVHLAQKPGGKVSGLLNAERLMVAKQLEQHFSMNGAATGAVLDSKVTGERGFKG